jgi:putative hemolysin
MNSRAIVVDRHAAAIQPGVGFILAFDRRYRASIAKNAVEIMSALRLRHEVFSVEIAKRYADKNGLEMDAFDFRSDHLVATEHGESRCVGTYRINSLSLGENIDRFYSFNEFTIESLPLEILDQGIEIGRACIAPEHRNSKVLFLLWKALANHAVRSKKRYVFGCCSMFTTDPRDGAQAYRRLADEGNLHNKYRVAPRRNAVDLESSGESEMTPSIPPLFEIYLRLGAKVCGPPMIDHEFGTIDFFTLLDLEEINERYRRMFFDR